MDAFPPNSRKAAEMRREPEAPKRIEQVTTAEAHRRNKPLGKKFKETFIGGDAKTTANYVFFDVFVPELKGVIVDSVTRWFENTVLGESRGGPRRRPGPQSGYTELGRVNYSGISSRISRGPAQQQGRQISPRARQQHDFGEIQVASRGEANDVLDRMYDLLSKYEYVTVSDLYALTGIKATHVDEKWGWTNLQGSAPRRNRSGDYILDLPNPEYLEN
jgi:hypothetical protein